MKIALVHDYFTQLGGAEAVALELYRILPGADLYTTVAIGRTIPRGLHDVHIRTTWMQKLPAIDRYYRAYFLLYPLAVASLDLSGYDLILSSSSGYMKGVRTSPYALHVCYCHTPMRWAWNFDHYAARDAMSPLKRILLPPLIGGLRRWDQKASRQPDHFIANSKAVAQRILKAYDRLAEVIHPPINVDRFRPSNEQDDYYLVLSRLVSYKCIDLAVEAATRMGRRLLVIGSGPDRARLEKLAGPTVEFLGRLTDSEVEYYASRARALLFPGEEDFGMAPLEVAAAGRPTIAFGAGGALETIVDGVTGVFFKEPTAASLIGAIERFESLTFHKERLRVHAEGFRTEVFEQRLYGFLSRIGAPLRAIEEAAADEDTPLLYPSPAIEPALKGMTA